MRKKLSILLSAVLLISLLSACGSSYNNSASSSKSASSVKNEQKTEPSISQINLDVGVVTIYDYGNLKLHAYATNDSLGDEVYILENNDALVGIELPSFTDSLNAWQTYILELDKPMNDIFLCSHATGASYIKDMNVYGTQGAKNAIENGSTFATTQGLFETFGDDFHGGSDMAQINNIVSGTLTVVGIKFNVIDYGDTYDLEIPELNVIYTHMLGKTSHSILTSVEYMNSMLEILKGYQNAGYDMILSAHSSPEGQDAVTEKILYIEKAMELAESSENSKDFITAMKENFPSYTGENYLEMSASYLYQ